MTRKMGDSIHSIDQDVLDMEKVETHFRYHLDRLLASRA